METNKFTIEGRIVVFNFKLIHLPLFAELPTSRINLLTKIQMDFV